MPTPDEVQIRAIRGVAQLAGRTVALRGITLVGTLVLARLLTPADFGAFAIVSSCVIFFAAIGDVGLGGAVIQQTGAPSRLELATVWTAQQLVAVALTAIAWLAAPLAGAAFGDLPADATLMIRALAVSLLFNSLRTLPAVLLERELRFGLLAAAEVGQALAYYGTSIALALAGAGVWSFVVAAVVQSAVGAVWLNLASGAWPGVSLDRAIVRRLFGFGVDFQLSLLVTWLRDGMVPFLGGLLASAATVGYLNFAWRIAQLVNSAEEVVGRIAFPAFSRLQHDRPRLQEALDQATLSTTFIVAPLQCWVAATAGLLVPLAFGPQWTPAIAVVQLVCLGTLARYPSRYLRQALFALGRSRAGLGLAAASLLVHVAAFVPGLALGGLIGAALAYVVATALTLMLFEISLRGLLTAVSRRYLVLLAAGLIAGVAAAIVVAWQPNLLGLGASALAAVAVYLAMIARAEPQAIASGRQLLAAVRSGAMARSSR